MEMESDELDLRFAEIGYELAVVSEYISLLEAYLPSIVEAEKRRIWERLGSRDPDTAHHLQDLLEQGVTTRFLAAAGLIATWAVYEAGVNSVADHVRQVKQVSLKMSDLRGDFLTRAKMYFQDVLKLELHPLATDWDRLKRLASLRNVLTHTNGRLEDIHEDERRRIQSWTGAATGVEILDEEYVVVSLAFVSDSWKFLDRLLNELTERVRKQF